MERQRGRRGAGQLQIAGPTRPGSRMEKRRNSVYKTSALLAIREGPGEKKCAKWVQFALTPNKAPVAVQTHGTEVHRSRDNRRGEGHPGGILVPWKVPLDVKTGMLEGNPGADGSRRFHVRVLHEETGSTPPRGPGRLSTVHSPLRRCTCCGRRPVG